jgi:two-component sensor histidine kinase
MIDAAPVARHGGRDARRVAEKIQGFDWGRTPLGPSQRWPQSLKTTLSLMLNSPFPMWLVWGEGLTYFYNDAFQPHLGDKPEALGRSFADISADVSPSLAPIMQRALQGEASYFEDFGLTLERCGYPERTWWTFAYSPVLGEGGEVAGVLCVGRETTGEVTARATLSTERERLARLFEQTPSHIAFLSGPNHVYELVNEAHRRLAPGREILGKSARDAFPEIAGQGVFELLDQVYASGRGQAQTGVEIALADPNGVLRKRYVDILYQPITAEDGAVTGIFVEGRDVTQRVAAEAAVREREERLALAVDAGRMGAWDLEVNTGEITLSAGAIAMLGLPARQTYALADLEGGSLPGEFDRLRTALAEARGRNDASFEGDFRHIRADDGELRWFLIRGRAEFVAASGSLRCFGVLMDLTERKAAEERLHLLAREVDHRANNLLAAVQSVVNLTRAPDVPTFRARIRGRLGALANAHRLLAESRWTGACLARVVAEELEPYRDGLLRIAGPDAKLAPPVAQALAIALHELATNAAKHGSLSTPNGRTRVSWTKPDKNRLVHMTWLEQGGPPTQPQPRAGFGMTLLTRAFAGQPGCGVALDWRPGGLCCQLTFAVL